MKASNVHYLYSLLSMLMVLWKWNLTEYTFHFLFNISFIHNHNLLNFAQNKMQPYNEIRPFWMWHIKTQSFLLFCVMKSGTRQIIWLLKYLCEVWEVLNLPFGNNEQPPPLSLSSAGILACLLLEITRSLSGERHFHADMQAGETWDG